MSGQIKFVQLFQYGGPVAELEIDGEKHLFEPEGVQALLDNQTLGHQDIKTLEKVLQELAAYRYAYGELQEINSESISGQLRIGI